VELEFFLRPTVSRPVHGIWKSCTHIANRCEPWKIARGAGRRCNFNRWVSNNLSTSWSSSCGRQSVDQFVWVLGLPLGPLTRFYLVLLFSADKYLILLSKASSLTRKRVCSLQCTHSVVPITILYRLIRHVDSFRF
jgi:hypothetical protein